MDFYLTVATFVLWALHASTSNGQELTTYCHTEHFNAACGKNQVVLMTSATYGRMETTRCVDRNYGYLGCKVSVLGAADSLCSGRRNCSVGIPHALFEKDKPCPNDLKSYLAASYTCINVVPSSGHMCRRTAEYVRLTEPRGTIAAALTAESALGSADCPWLIQARSGQRINVTLLDFSLPPEDPDRCHAYFILREKDPPNSATVCGEGKRVRHVYMSKSPALEVRVMTQKNKAKVKYFLIKYEVVGCADIDAPLNGWAKRSGDRLEIGCRNPDKSWILTCDGSTWKGNLGNCSQEIATVAEISWGNTSLPFGISLVIIVAIALAIGVVILIIGLATLRWQRSRRLPAREAQPQIKDGTYGRAVNKYHPNMPVRPASQLNKDQEGLYASENEYAYISDFPPPPPPLPEAGAMSMANRDLYHSAKRPYMQAHHQGNVFSGYGTTGHPARALVRKLSNTHAHGTSRDPNPAQAHARVHANEAGIMLEDPPKYFELVPTIVRTNSKEGATAAASNTGANVGARAPHNRCSNPQAGAKHGDPTAYPSSGTFMSRMHKSIHEFSPTSYDHFASGDCEGENHKSV